MAKDPRLPFEEIGRDEFAELYSWSIKEAFEAEKAWRAMYPDGIRGPLIRWSAAQHLEGLRYNFERGDKSSVLEAVAECAINGLPLPSWCAQAFFDAFSEVKRYKARSWDDVFGSPHPKGTNLGAKRRKRELRFSVYSRIREIKKEYPETPMDIGLFEQVGKEFGICRTLAEEYYYSVKNDFDETFKVTEHPPG